MLNAVTGFVVVGFMIGIGYLLARIDLLGDQARVVLGRLTFFVLSPILMFSVLAHANIHTLFSALLPVSAIAAAAMVAGYVLVARLAWRRPLADTVIGALGSGQVNSNNIGIPLSLYLLGSAAYPAPVILLQLIAMTPVALTLLDTAATTHRRLGPLLRRVALNPLIIGSLLGVVVSLTGLPLPQIVSAPIDTVAAACVPLLLIGYGMSLRGQRVLGAREHRRDILVASALKLVAMPLVAWAVAQFVFGLSRHDVLIVVVLAALPTAQNVFNYAQHYRVGEIIARDTVLITTIGCVPVLFAVMWLLG
ncbi:AEC family transporter [Microbacterium sp. X-17]|uniref:AEC family transporter n=1 Tax=Microbacterium sp. X-17 TaxID=3144404 RepID=UPI0031F4BD6D